MFCEDLPTLLRRGEYIRAIDTWLLAFSFLYLRSSEQLLICFALSIFFFQDGIGGHDSRLSES